MNYFYYKLLFQNGDWGLGIGDWGLGIGPNPQSPIPIFLLKYLFYKKNLYLFK